MNNYCYRQSASKYHGASLASPHLTATGARFDSDVASMVAVRKRGLSIR